MYHDGGEFNPQHPNPTGDAQPYAPSVLQDVVHDILVTILDRQPMGLQPYREARARVALNKLWLTRCGFATSSSRSLKAASTQVALGRNGGLYARCSTDTTCWSGNIWVPPECVAEHVAGSGGSRFLGQFTARRLLAEGHAGTTRSNCPFRAEPVMRPDARAPLNFDHPNRWKATVGMCGKF